MPNIVGILIIKNIYNSYWAIHFAYTVFNLEVPSQMFKTILSLLDNVEMNEDNDYIIPYSEIDHLPSLVFRLREETTWSEMELNLIMFTRNNTRNETY